MKRIMLWFVLFSMVCLSSCVGSNYEIYEENSIWYGINTKNKTGYVFVKNWDFDLDNTECIIADEVNDCKIVSFGGYIGIGSMNYFRINFVYDNPYVSYHNEKTLAVGMEIKEIEFKIHLNKYLKNVVFAESVESISETYIVYNENPNTAYRITYYFLCPEENETFYAENGKLYYKSTDELVEEFYKEE